jgi:hypothetical protein
MVNGRLISSRHSRCVPCRCQPQTEQVPQGQARSLRSSTTECNVLSSRKVRQVAHRHRQRKSRRPRSRRHASAARERPMRYLSSIFDTTSIRFRKLNPTRAMSALGRAQSGGISQRITAPEP